MSIDKNFLNSLTEINMFSSNQPQLDESDIQLFNRIADVQPIKTSSVNNTINLNNEDKKTSAVINEAQLEDLIIKTLDKYFKNKVIISESTGNTIIMQIGDSTYKANLEKLKT